MAGEVIGRGSYELDADITKVRSGVKDANAAILEGGKATEDAYAKTGTRSGALLKTGITQGAKVAAAGAALAFGAATKGGVQLEEVMARYQAATGASADEAKRTAGVINRVAGDNRVSLEQVADAAAKVHNDLGLTGAAADAMTERIVKFARVTGQDAGQAVTQLDDVTDAYNLTSEKSNALLDQLVVSHQKYGGSISENQAALARMAPQLLAMNATVDDGVGLLNLFATSGIDASKAQGALNFAVKNLKPGQTLNDLVAQIGAIPDPAQRAQKAIQLFGARGGVALANALKPGKDSLKDFEVTASDSAGAIDKAANALDSTFSAQIQKKISQAGAAVRQFGLDVGPAVTGLASLASIAGALKIDVGIEKAFKAVAGSGAVKAAAGAAGAAAGLVYQGAAFVAEQFVGVVTGAWTKIAASPAVMAAAGAAGGSAGAAFSAAMSVGLVVGVAAIADNIHGPLNDVATNIHNSISPLKNFGDWVKTNIGGPNDWPWPLGNKDAPDWAKFKQDAKDGATGVGTAAGEGLAGGMERERPTFIEAGKEFVGRLGEGAAAEAPRTVDSIGNTLASEFQSHGTKAWIASARQAGNRAAGGVAEGIIAQRQAPVDAMDTLREMLKNAMSPAKEDARFLGELTSKELARGLKSNDPAVRAQAQFTKQSIIDRLNELPPQSFTKGSAASKELARALKSKDPDVRAAAEHVANVATKPLGGMPAIARQDGVKTGQAYGDGLSSTSHYIMSHAANALAGAKQLLNASSPPSDPRNPLHKIDVMGRKTMEAYADGMLAAKGTVRDAATSALGFDLPGMTADGVLRAMGTHSVEVGGTVTHRLEMTPAMAASLRSAGYSAGDVAQIASTVDATRFVQNLEHLISTRTTL